MENTNSTNIKDLFLADELWIVPWVTERMPQRIQRHRRTTLHWSVNPQRQRQGGNIWLWSGLTIKRHMYSPRNQDNNLFQNIQNIRWSPILYQEKYENLEWNWQQARKNLAETKIQRGIFQGDALSLLLFIIAMMPLNYILRKRTKTY